VNEGAGAAPHRFNGGVDAAPARHHDDRQQPIAFVDLLEQVETLTTRGRVARVIEIHQDEVVVLRVETMTNFLHRRRRIDFETGTAQQHADGGDDILLVVSNENT
jgi:hypothetical protein